METRLKTGSMLAAGAMILSLAGAAEASTITVDFTSGSSSTGNNYGNSLSLYNSGGITVTGTAWAFDTSLNPDKFQTAALDKYAGGFGLGVCNQGEGRDCSSPEHQIDNSPGSRTDFVLFTFSQAVDPASIYIKTFNDADLDVSYWVGNTTAAALNNAQLGANYSLTNMGLMQTNNCSGSCSADERLVSLTSGYVTSLLIGARLAGSTGSDSYSDYFKIQTLKFDTQDVTLQAVPEPGSLMLMGTGFTVLAMGLRRRLKK